MSRPSARSRSFSRLAYDFAFWTLVAMLVMVLAVAACIAGLIVLGGALEVPPPWTD